MFKFFCETTRDSIMKLLALGTWTHLQYAYLNDYLFAYLMLLD
jgi:hypothetical protein